MPARHSTNNAKSKLEQLASDGVKSHHRGHHAECMRLMSAFEAGAKGEARVSPKVLADARFWHGTAFHASGRLREAQGILAMAFANGSFGEASGGFMALTRHLLVSSELPLPLTGFQDELARVESLIRETRYRYHSSRILHIRSCLEFDRGNLEEARVLAEKAFAAQSDEKSIFATSAHRRIMVGIFLASGDPREARRRLEGWTKEVGRESNGSYAQTVFNAARANLARHEGRPEEAVEWALLTSLDTHQSEDYVSRITVGFAQVRASLATQRPQRARRPLAEILKLRHGELARDRYRIRLLHADFHLAMARSLLGLPVLDLEFGGRNAAGDQGRDPMAAGGHLAKAERGYGRALLAGRLVDRLLCCNFRKQEMKSRIAVALATHAAFVWREQFLAC
jgi:ATP/maltotriose-dependent transcriptional regulator MalT